MKKKFHKYVPTLYTVKITYDNGQRDTIKKCDRSFVESLALNVFQVFCGHIGGFVFADCGKDVIAIDVDEISVVSVYDEKRRKYMELMNFVNSNMPIPTKMLLL